MSLDSRQPIEAYRFEGSFRNYFYTSADRSFSLNGEGPYETIPISRGAVRTTSQNDTSSELEIILPFDVQVVKDYAYLESPPSLNLSILVVDRDSADSLGNFSGNAAVLWSGEVTGWSVSQRQARVRVPSILSTSFQNQLPSVFYQSPCNHVLYDQRCKVNRASFTNQATVTGINGTTINVNDDANVDNFLTAGEIVNTRNNERRLILTNLSDVIRINTPFVDLQIGDTVDLVAGCDHSFTICRTKFNNTINFGGFPYIPTENPFEGTL